MSAKRMSFFGFVARYRRCCCKTFQRRWAFSSHDAEDGQLEPSNTTWDLTAQPPAITLL
jgi:hypothetical protein